MNKANLLYGLLFAAAGLAAAVAIYLRPEGLRAPSWVAYAAASAFVIAGFVVAAIEFRARNAFNWLVVLLLLVMSSVAAWVGFGPGTRACSINLGGFDGPASDLLCRSAFGLGAVMLVAMLFLAIRFAIAGKNAD